MAGSSCGKQPLENLKYGQFFQFDTGLIFPLILQCLYEDPNSIGSTAVKIIGNRVVVAKLNGCIDFLEIDSYRRGKRESWGFSSFRRSKFELNSE